MADLPCLLSRSRVCDRNRVFAVSLKNAVFWLFCALQTVDTLQPETSTPLRKHGGHVADQIGIAPSQTHCISSSETDT